VRACVQCLRTTNTLLFLCWFWFTCVHLQRCPACLCLYLGGCFDSLAGRGFACLGANLSLSQALAHTNAGLDRLRRGPDADPGRQSLACYGLPGPHSFVELTALRPALGSLLTLTILVPPDVMVEAALDGPQADVYHHDSQVGVSYTEVLDISSVPAGASNVIDARSEALFAAREKLQDKAETAGFLRDARAVAQESLARRRLLSDLDSDPATPATGADPPLPPPNSTSTNTTASTSSTANHHRGVDRSRSRGVFEDVLPELVRVVTVTVLFRSKGSYRLTL